MKKFDVFIRSPRARKYRGSGLIVLAGDAREAARIASDRFVGFWIKVLPGIVYA